VTTITPYRSDVRPGRDGFARLLHAEWTKFRTVRGWIIAMIVAIGVSAGLGLLAPATDSSSCAVSGGGGQPSSGGCQPAAPSYILGPGGEPVTDSFYFVRQPLAGDGSITVRVTSLMGIQPWTKAGVIIKQNQTPGSAYAAMMVTHDHGVRMQWNYTGDTAGLSGAVGPANPRWLRLTRVGDVITGYDSADGAHWTQVGAVTLSGLPATVQAGLFTASPNYVVSHGVSAYQGPTQATAVFDHLALSGAQKALGGLGALDSWRGEYFGAGQGSGSGSGAYHQAGGQFTVTGSGDIAPVTAGHGGAADGAQLVGNILIGTFAGLIAIAVVATMFITSEYRRKLIRTTLAASPRRGRVLAAKAIVIGAVSFVAGVIGAAVALSVGTKITDSRGNYMFPTPLMTEVRAVIGTGLLVAVAAVLILAVGAMVRRSAATIAIAIVVFVVPYFLSVTAVLPIGADDWLLRVTPAAGYAIQGVYREYAQVAAIYSAANGYYPLAPWIGFLVLCAWAALALAGATCLLRRRDA
jgi:ABC-type transport system involved in multi-copper enzyme maturation permease subunit